MLLLFVLALGFALGFVTGGNLSSLKDVRLDGEVIMLAAFVVQSGLRNLGESLDIPTGLIVGAWVAVTLALGSVAFLNSMPGLKLLGAGMLTNGLVVGVNGGMPVAAESLRIGGMSDELVEAIGSSGFYFLGDSSTWAPMLGDVLPLPLGRWSAVLSLGDLLMFAAVVVFLIWGMSQNRSNTSGRFSVD